MPKKSMNWYGVLYTVLMLIELGYVFLAWSPYGESNGAFKKFYQYIKQNLNTYVVFGLILLVVLGIFFPGLGYLAFGVTLYRVSEMCCKENFGDGLNYGWGSLSAPGLGGGSLSAPGQGGGRYYPDDATFFNQGHIRRDQDGTKASYSSAVGDSKDVLNMAKLAEFENRINRVSASAMKRKVLEFQKDGCGCGVATDQAGGNGNWIIPQIKDLTVTGPEQHLCNGTTLTGPGLGTGVVGTTSGGCNMCDIKKYGSIFEEQIRPRPLYTTSLLSREMGSA